MNLGMLYGLIIAVVTKTNVTLWKNPDFQRTFRCLLGHTVLTPDVLNILQNVAVMHLGQF